jgi:adenosine/AMP kinase
MKKLISSSEVVESVHGDGGEWEVCPAVADFCATANAAEIILAATEQGRAILGVVDDASPKGVDDDDIAWRRDLLRKIGYKL